MSNNNNDIGVRPVTSNLGNKPLNSTNSVLYILVMEDPSVKGKTRCFATNKVDKASWGVDFRGYEVSNINNAQENLKTYENAVEFAKTAKTSLIEMTIPWQRIISITNMSYKAK